MKKRRVALPHGARGMFAVCCLAIVVLVIVLFLVALDRSSTDACITTEGGPILSPDRTWAAWTEETGCDYGFGTGYAIWNVRLQSRTQSYEPTTIFSTDDDGERSKPQLRWLANRRLLIATSNTFGIGIQTIRFAGVVISYRYALPATDLGARGRPRW